jgi:lactoylglutathione lyase
VRDSLFKQIDYVMVIVSNMSRSIEFYRDKLGLQLKSESPEWTEFQTGTTVLALHGGGKLRPNLKEKTESFAGTCSIGFTVDNLEKKFEELNSKGVVFVMPPARREEEGIELAVLLDPDGLPISLAENLRS